MRIANAKMCGVDIHLAMSGSAVQSTCVPPCPGVCSSDATQRGPGLQVHCEMSAECKGEQSAGGWVHTLSVSSLSS